MENDKRFLLRALSALFVAVCCLNACASSTSTLPALSAGPQRAVPASVDRTAAVAQATSDLVAIDCGGAATGSFVADTDYTQSEGGYAYKTSAAIATSGIANPAPQAVYQSQRTASAMTYTIPGLTPGATYGVVLSFAELYWTASGKRTFNVSINGSSVLSNFDIFATAGARYKAVAKSFTATASSTGTIAIALTSVVNIAVIDGIEITGSPGATPTPTATPTAQPTGTPAPGLVLAINAGGSAVGAFVADRDYNTGGYAYKTTAAIDTSAVTNPAPQAVYQSQRTGSPIVYTIPKLTAAAAYTVRLDFAELYWSSTGQRVANIAINGTTVATGFDIIAAAGARNKAVALTYPATADANGTIAISVTATTNTAVVNGVEISTSATGPTPTPTPTGTPIPTPAPFNDYVTFGYDNARDTYDPNTTGITPATLSKLHLAWQSSNNDYGTQTQPILATEISGHAGVLFVGGGTGDEYAYDALTGKLIWSVFTGQMTYDSCGGGTSYFGVGGTAAYDPATKSLYVVGNSNPTLNAYASDTLYHIDGATGTILGRANFSPTAAGTNEQNFTHTAVALNNGVAYVGTGSTCDISSWRGRVAAINVPAMTLANTFFTLWDPQNVRGNGSQPWSGGGVWGWGGVALDAAGNVLTGVGNADDGSPNGTIAAPFVAAPTEYSGYAESLLELSPNLGSALASQHPIAVTSYGGVSSDIDVQGTPLVVQPNGAGCPTMVALQGKAGQLTLYNENSINAGYVAQYQLSPSTYDDGYLGDPAYSPATGLIYADVASSVSPTLFAPGLIAINPGCGNPSVTWHAAFGSDSTASGLPRSVPAVSAGGVVFVGSVNGSYGNLWAVDAATGTVLNGGTPLLQTSDYLRVPATIDGNWVFVIDQSGDMYGLTTDPSYPAIAAKVRSFNVRSRTRFAVRRR